MIWSKLFSFERSNFFIKKNKMSFKVVKMENSSLLSDEANKSLTQMSSRVNPTEEFASELPSSLAHLQIKPFIQVTFLCDHLLDMILNMDIHSDDVFVCSLAKCGSSWLQVV